MGVCVFSSTQGVYLTLQVELMACIWLHRMTMHGIYITYSMYSMYVALYVLGIATLCTLAK